MALNLRIPETTLEERILVYLESEKQKRHKKIRKLADILIRDELISFELSQKYIRELRKLQSGDPFEELLLAFFMADAEEWEACIRSLEEILDRDFTGEFKEDIRHLILLIRISELKVMPAPGELATLLEAISSEENIVPVLWKLNELLDAGKNPDLFFPCLEKAKALYPQVFRISNFLGWIYAKDNKVEPAITAFSHVLEGLQKEDPEDPRLPYELATVMLNLAECHLLMPVPDQARVVEYCNAALEQGEVTEDAVMEIIILLTRAKAHLLPDANRDQNQHSAREDIRRILELDPKNREALKLLQELDESPAS